METIYSELAQIPYQHRKAGSDQQQDRKLTAERLRLTDEVIMQHIELQGKEPEDGDFRIEGEL